MTLILLNSLFIFALRVADVSLGTIRTVLIMRGMRTWAAAVGFVEITIWVTAISKVVGHLTHIGYIIGYSGGFATGTLVGMWILEKLSLGHVKVRIISMKQGEQIIAKIREAGYGATLMQAQGHSGTVFLLEVVALRRRLPDILKTVKGVDAKAFLTIEDAPQVIGGYERLSK